MKLFNNIALLHATRYTARSDGRWRMTWRRRAALHYIIIRAIDCRTARITGEEVRTDA